MEQGFDLVEEFSELPDVPARQLVNALRACSVEDMQAAVEELSRTGADKLFELASVTCDVNPTRKVPGPEPGYRALAYLAVEGLAPGADESSARVAGMRFLRERENCTLTEAHTICRNIIAGRLYTYPVEDKSVSEQRAAYWSRAGFACRVVPHGDPPPAFHEQSFVQMMMAGYL